ncbi:SURF1 family protein [Brachybacterium sp. UNK5269]|uniref:SURF1 family cytochrome oxidase biogenesis protein n=1 Tax=Brachybacterium sp. UNK5269 TaxID=3408576 RepID=UPI003BB0ACFF
MTSRSSRLRSLLGRETLLGLVAVLVLGGVCVALGFWQFGRYEDRRDAAAVVEANYAAAPVPLETVLSDPAEPLASQDDWTPVALDGSYCTEADCVLYVRNRQLSGEVGFWQLVPFRSEDGATVLVVRGWVPQADDGSVPADAPAVPAGELTATVRMRPAEPLLDRELPTGQVHSVHPPQIAALLGLPPSSLVTGAYGELADEEPSAARPAALPAPDTSLGPHLSYAFQWWIFALFFPGALVFNLRQRYQDLAAGEQDAASAGAGPLPAPAADPAATAAETTDLRPRRAVRARRRGHDEEEEDALIDRQAP